MATLFALVIGVISVFLFVFFSAQQAGQAREALLDRAASIAQMAAFSVRSGLVFEDTEAMRDALAGAARTHDVLYVGVTDTTGTILAYRHRGEGDPTDTHHVAEAFGRPDVHRVSTPVEFNGDTLGFVSLSVHLGGLETQVRRARQISALVSALIFLLGMTAVILGSRFVTRPLLDIVGTAQKIAEGDLSERADITSRDEVGKLASVFNVMVGRLQEAHEELEQTNRDLEDRVEKRTRQWRKSEQLLRQAQKMEAVGRLAAGVAHDFNNLLTVINGQSELLLLELDEDDPMREGAESISIAGESAALLTQQLLAFSRKQVLQPTDLDFNEVVENVGKMLGRLLGETVELHGRPGSSLGTVRADPGQIEQVLLNLAVNARDAMPDGGHLTLATQNRRVAIGDELHIEGLEDGDYVELTITDTGHGMSEETRALAFEPFFTTKPGGKGTGLGLATVHGIVSQSGGHIRVESVVGRGTTFSLYFPRHLGKAEVRAVGPETPWEGGSERILLVEDDHQVRGLARRMLERGGHEVVEADCGETALERCAEHGGRFDLLRTDVVMPGMNGRELELKVRELHPSVAVMYMSGYTDDEVILGGVRDQDVIFLEKPFTPDGLLSAVRGAIEGRKIAR